MNDAAHVWIKQALRLLTQGLTAAEEPTHHATSFRYAEKAWIRTGKHLRKAIEEYDQEETSTRSHRSE